MSIFNYIAFYLEPFLNYCAFMKMLYLFYIIVTIIEQFRLYKDQILEKTIYVYMCQDNICATYNITKFQQADVRYSAVRYSLI